MRKEKEQEKLWLQKEVIEFLRRKVMASERSHRVFKMCFINIFYS